MGKIFLEYISDERVYACANCAAHLTALKHIISSVGPLSLLLAQVIIHMVLCTVKPYLVYRADWRFY